MLYIRVSLMVPKDGCERDVAQIMDDLMAFYERQRGFIHGHKLRSADGNALIGRVTVWQSEQAADAAAQKTHVMARRSDLQPLVEEDSHIERSFDATEGAQFAGRDRHRRAMTARPRSIDCARAPTGRRGV